MMFFPIKIPARLLFRQASRFVVALSVSAGATANSAPTVGDALDRPSVATRLAAHSVLLAASRAGARVVAVGERGIVILSDDAGRSWRQVSAPVSVTLTAVRFADERHGIAVGHGGVVLVTSDRGETWSRRFDGKQAADLAMRSANAAGDEQAIKEAKRLVADGADKPLLDAIAFDAARALVVGAYGLIFETRDGGASWTPWMNRLDNPRALHLYAARVRANVMVIAGEQGLLLRSDDGGGSFRRITTPYKGSFFTLELPSDQEIVVAGLRGNAWRSIDAGATWSRLDNPVPVSFTGSTLKGDEVVLVNQAGMVFSGRDGAFAPMHGVPLPSLNGVLALEGGALLGLSIAGAIAIPTPAVGAAVGAVK